ncbi:MAG: hypothetical protein ACLPHI_14860 [Terriglobales bacterium]
MRQGAVCWFFVATGFLLLGLPLLGQSGIVKGKDTDNAGNGRGHIGYVQDWSSRYLLRPGTRVEDVVADGYHDPRLIYSMLRHQAALKGSDASGAPLRPEASERSKVDWAVSLENGYVAQDQFPAKYAFVLNTENCESDFVVFALNVNTNTFTQGNLVGINNLYTGMTPTPCNGGSPWVSFAYNTQTQPSGQLFTSPVLSVDGELVAFVESTPTGSYFHVLVLPNPVPTPGAIPSHVGTVLSPAIPTACAKPNPNNAGCMTTLMISSSSDSLSSPFVDYNSDTAYVGDDNGILHKITPVFGGGAPALVTNSDWPVTVSTSGIPILSDPVVDTNSGRIFMGDLDGYLYAVSLAGPGRTVSAQIDIGVLGFPGAGFVDPPSVVNDPANPGVDQVFAVTGCSVVSDFGGAVTQIPANFTNLTTATTSNTVGLSTAKTGAGTCTEGSVHGAVFDNLFYVDGSTSGHVIACGFVSAGANASRPRMYMVPFSSHVITNNGAALPNFGPDTTGTDECSPLTEFYNGTTDRLFFGVGNSFMGDKTPDGFLESATLKPKSFTAPTCTGAPTSTCVTAPPAIEGVSGISIDNEVSDGGTNIYFTTLGPGSVNGGSCHVSGGLANPYCAVKLTQSGLN